MSRDLKPPPKAPQPRADDPVPTQPIAHDGIEEIPPGTEPIPEPVPPPEVTHPIHDRQALLDEFREGRAAGTTTVLRSAHHE
jgi:hypothetical protein